MTQAKLLVLFHSFYGNVFRLAEAVADGARGSGAEVFVKQVPETVPEAALAASGALATKKTFEHVPTATVDELPTYDGIAFGTGTRFGNMSSSMRSFFDQTGKLWNEGALLGKAGTVFAATGTGGGRETTIVSTWFTLAHHGMIIVPAGYGNSNMRQVDEVHGGNPYGITTVSRAKAPRPSEIELDLARSQGRSWADVAIKLARD
ncbi:NAD(P)H:quinone oxidoreductase [Bradyrhizobium sp. LTSPM299]|uniref:NAD(P)H:quinone oxidoreductase n=1 Tax=Bradyrhizobium sp. LTSPM299 TaxID=1619233 RepID=UPI0005C836BB|nr:NAD(P)H:quinone oxidoreductase [Bradyrhizobium sp. LTSPM299]KJC60334.1 NAD(P)H:quinone oxidoreductase [Bradyrhizobium sp. LTSPM299]